MNGLSDNRMRSLHQLPDGRMIMVTEGMINIFNGTSFSYMHYNEQKAYHLSKYYGSHRVYVDNENHLWLKNQQKLMLFDIRTELFVPDIDSVFLAQGVQKHVLDLFMDSRQNLWYVTEKDELFCRDTKNGTTRLYLTQVSYRTGFSDQLFDIAIHEDLLFLFYKSGEMICLNLETKKELYRENPFKEKRNAYSNALRVIPYEQYLYQIRYGNNMGLLNRFNILNRKWERILETDYKLNSFSVDKSGNCWISSYAGLWRIDKNLLNKRLIKQFNLIDGSVIDSEIGTQFNDNKEGLWLGTVNRGVLYYHPDRFKFRNFGPSLFRPSSDESLSVFCFTEVDSSIWIGTQNGLYRYNKNAPYIDRLRIIPANTYCEMLLKDSKQRIWVCTKNQGLFCIDNGIIRNYLNTVWCQYLFEAFDGRFYLCTNKGVGIFDPETGSYKNLLLPSGINFGSTYQIMSFRNDSLLGYGDEGLFLYNGYSKYLLPPAENSPLLQHNSHHYHCLFSDSRGLIWLGTMDGLYVYNSSNKRTLGFFEEEGLVNNSIRSIIEDNYGRIWVTTSNGISRIDVVFNKEVIKCSFANFNHFDGIIENEFLPRSVFKTSDNRLLWGGINGFNEIDLKSIDTTRQLLSIPLFIKLLISGNEIKTGREYHGSIILKQSISATHEIHLKHFQNFFGIEFTSLNYVNPTQTYYRYMLEGVDNSWQELKTNDGIGRVNYTSLAAGTYRLKVLAANNSSRWDSHYAMMTIIIHPPFWKTIWAYVIYMTVLLVSVYFSITYYVRRNKLLIQKQQKNELDQLKFSFFTNISHELRTPLSLILTPLDSIIKKTEDGFLKQQLIGIKRNAKELLKMVNQLLDFRKLELKGETLQLNYCNISEFCETIAYSFRELKSDKDIDFNCKLSEPNIYAYVDKDKLQKIINNLLSNAFKFTPQGGLISLNLQMDSSKPIFKIQVTDTGCGIHEADLPQIFDRFYQAKNHQGENTGSGIGLHLLKEYVVLHNGTVEVESHINKGSSFIITIPANLQPECLPVSEMIAYEGKKNLNVLIVEDNFEFRTFLQNELSDKFRVLAARNGKEGLKMACEHPPDLVITDVMMPEINGIEFCQLLKSDVRISHIPVILLTAKASDQAQIEGFEAGADAYITKPFNMDILLLRINHLIEQQQKKITAFKKTIVLNPESFTNTNVDEELIKKALAKIEKNIDNVSYSVEQLSKDMCMDRTGLYRKLVAIVGLTPTEFIRSIRLKRSAQLLISGLSVAEVADRVGFSGSTSYFAKCFYEEFGSKPSQYKDLNK